MSSQISLKEAEHKTFTSAFEDGLWDIFLGSVVLMFAIGPFLPLGDFWSSAVFLPFWALVYVGIRLVRKYMVKPRVGLVRFGRARIAKLRRFTLLALAFNVIVFVLATVSAYHFDGPGWTHMVRFSLVALVGFSVAGYSLGFARLYLYGALGALSPIIGEVLYRRLGASHHGFPITFGTTAGIMIVIGLVKFVRLVRERPLPPAEELFTEKA